MRAVRYHGPRDIRLEEIPPPEAGPDSVLVKPAFTGICGSDLHLYQDGANGLAPSWDVAHPLSGETLPVVLGHEFSGTVVRIGEEVDDLRVGESVVVEPVMVDGTCGACRRGHYNLCAQLGFRGISGKGGGLSELVAVPRRWVHRVGDLSLDEAALIEPLAVAVHAARHAGARAGQTAVIAGAGPIGLLVAAVLRASDVTTIVSEPSNRRRAMAVATGAADHVIDPRGSDLFTFVETATGGLGADIAFDAAGAGAVISDLFEVLGAGGHLEVVALHTEPYPLQIAAQLMRHDRTMGSSLGYADDFPTAIELARSGQVRLGDFITSRIAAERIVEDGFERLLNDRDSEVKILVHLS